MAVATIGAAAASPCLRHVHLLGLLIEAHPVEKFLWAKFKMQGDIMILLSDITLQVKVKLPYTDMMVTTSVTFCGRLTFKPKMLPSSIKTQLPSLWWNTLDVALQVRLWAGEVEIVRRSIDSDTMKAIPFEEYGNTQKRGPTGI
ncbi:uncharacterized protein [Oryza sativa Japonica Group]|uniref:uncharacterized protein isoform X1 n=1 Tax=Oryza sativa subsp. japonica TaxID=39947 RepID=UPI00339CFCB4